MARIQMLERDDMRVLFVTRKFPPSVGGMEAAAAALYESLSEAVDVKLVKWSGSNRLLPIVYPLLLIRAAVACAVRRPDVVYLQDGVLAPIGRLIGWVFRLPTVITIHGREVTHRNAVYRIAVLPFIERQTRIVAVSDATRTAILKRLKVTHVTVIRNGVMDVFYDATASIQRLQPHLSALIEPLDGGDTQPRILLTAGRLVRRKGVAWFVREVLPRLVASHLSILYVIVGTGHEEETILDAISESGMDGHAVMLGRIDDQARNTLYNVADVLVMPNIPVPGDMEGFGLVAVEASSCGTPVVAARIEGICDAVIHGANGILVEPGDADGFVCALGSFLEGRGPDRNAVRSFTLETFSWEQSASAYIDVFEKARRSQGDLA